VLLSRSLFVLMIPLIDEVIKVLSGIRDYFVFYLLCAAKCVFLTTVFFNMCI